jgi:hypothetical protein
VDALAGVLRTSRSGQHKRPASFEETLQARLHQSDGCGSLSPRRRLLADLAQGVAESGRRPGFLEQFEQRPQFGLLRGQLAHPFRRLVFGFQIPGKLQTSILAENAV